MSKWSGFDDDEFNFEDEDHGEIIEYPDDEYEDNGRNSMSIEDEPSQTPLVGPQSSSDGTVRSSMVFDEHDSVVPGQRRSFNESSNTEKESTGQSTNQAANQPVLSEEEKERLRIIEIKNKTSKIDKLSMFIISTYFNTINDYINAEKSCKRYIGLIESFKYNPIFLNTEAERNIFKNIRTVHFSDLENPQLVIDYIKNSKVKVIIFDQDVPSEDAEKFLKSITDYLNENKIRLPAPLNDKDDYDYVNDPSPEYRRENSSSFNPKKDIIFTRKTSKIGLDGAINPVEDVTIVNGFLNEEQVNAGQNVDVPVTVLPQSEFNAIQRDIQQMGVDNVETPLYVIIPDNVKEIQDSVFKPSASIMHDPRERISKVTLPISVTQLGYECFKNCTLTSIDMDGVIEIGNGCFENCSNLQEINISSNLSKIDGLAFRGAGITSFSIPNNITSIPRYCFSDCHQLREITIPTNISSLSDSSFGECSNLSSVVLHDDISSIEGLCFRCCNQIQEIELPANLINLGYSAFEGCRSLTRVILPPLLDEVPTGCFSQCTNLITVDMSRCTNLRRIHQSAFEFCAITAIQIPGTVTSISDYVFNHCLNLQEVVLPQGVTKLEDYLFSRCTSLTKVICSSQIVNIGNECFYNCSNLRILDFDPEVTHTNFVIKIPSSVTNLGMSCFENCSSITSVIFQDNPEGGSSLLQIIPRACFKKCISLNYVHLSYGIIQLSYECFADCERLSNLRFDRGRAIQIGINIPGSIRRINMGSFSRSGVRLSSGDKDKVCSCD